ncbi:ABC transporter permease [Actinoplanes sp. NPDC051411]|uniref:ABC transporter permease n=1 Tax=Actinoplanes sp. NPDC051411 TaxID=3155522 RepID=UPI0034409FE6
MSDALRFEWVRLRTIRSTWWLIASGLLLNLAAAAVLAGATRHAGADPRIVADVVTAGGASFPVPLLAVFLAAIGIFATGHEYRYNTIQPTLTAIPQRARLLTAKVIVVGITAVIVTLVSMVLNTAAGMIWWDGLPGLTTGPLGQVLAGYVLLGLLWSVVGTALGQLFRSVPAPLVTILAVPLIVEQLVLRLSFAPSLHWLTPAVKFLPFTAGQQLVSWAGEASGGSETEMHMLARWPSAAIFVIFTAAVLSAALTLFRRRDA